MLVSELGTLVVVMVGASWSPPMLMVSPVSRLERRYSEKSITPCWQSRSSSCPIMCLYRIKVSTFTFYCNSHNIWRTRLVGLLTYAFFSLKAYKYFSTFSKHLR